MKKASNLSNILIGFGLSLILHFSTSTCTVAQLNEYHVEPLPKAMVPLSGTTTQIFGPSTFWKISSSIALPFQFTYLHQACSKIKVSTNGFLTFDTTETYHYLTNDLHAVDPINTLAPLWDRLGVSSSGKIHYATVGSAPNRIFVVEFYRVVWGPFSSPLVDFQIRLVEGTNDIEFPRHTPEHDHDRTKDEFPVHNIGYTSKGSFCYRHHCQIHMVRQYTGHN
jgi:hypothetical protein